MDRRKGREQGSEAGTDEARPGLLRSKFEVWGEEMIEKEVRLSGNSGRVYLPPEWIGRRVKVIRID